MSKLVKKVSNLFIDEVGRVNFVVGSVVDGRPVYYVYRTIDKRKGLEIFVDSHDLFYMLMSPQVFSVSNVSLRSVRKWIYDNYDNFAFKFPMIVEV